MRTKARGLPPFAQTSRSNIALRFDDGAYQFTGPMIAHAIWQKAKGSPTTTSIVISANVYGAERIQPCNACVSTSMALCGYTSVLA